VRLLRVYGEMDWGVAVRIVHGDIPPYSGRDIVVDLYASRLERLKGWLHCRIKALWRAFWGIPVPRKWYEIEGSA